MARQGPRKRRTSGQWRADGQQGVGRPPKRSSVDSTQCQSPWSANKSRTLLMHCSRGGLRAPHLPLPHRLPAHNRCLDLWTRCGRLLSGAGSSSSNAGSQVRCRASGAAALSPGSHMHVWRRMKGLLAGLAARRPSPRLLCRPARRPCCCDGMLMASRLSGQRGSGVAVAGSGRRRGRACGTRSDGRQPESCHCCTLLPSYLCIDWSHLFPPPCFPPRSSSSALCGTRVQAAARPAQRQQQPFVVTAKFSRIGKSECAAYGGDSCTCSKLGAGWSRSHLAGCTAAPEPACTLFSCAAGRCGVRLTALRCNTCSLPADPVPVPDKVTVDIQGQTVKVKVRSGAGSTMDNARLAHGWVLVAQPGGGSC